MPRAAIYTRLSRAPSDVPESSTARQERLCRDWLKAQGHRVVGVYSEVQSAAREEVIRPEFERMLVDLRRGRFDVVVAWKVDRFVRQPVDLERLRDACRTQGVLLRSVTETIDAADPMLVATARMLALFASFEGDTKGMRLRASHLHRAQAGAFPVDGVFGLNADGTALVEGETTSIDCGRRAWQVRGRLRGA